MFLKSLIAIKTRATLKIVTTVASQGTYNETVGFQKQRKECILMKKRIFKSVRGAKEKNKKREGTAKQIASENKKLRKKGCVGVQRKANEPGMYVSGTVNGVPISTLIDTGATVTLLSEKVFDILNHDGKVALAQSDLNILSATGTPLNIFWRSSHQIQVWEENHIPDGIGVGHQRRCDSRARLSTK